MRVTGVRVHLVNGNGGQAENPTRAFCTITLDDAFVVHGIRVVHGQRGLFVAYPAEKGRDGKWRDVCHPITAAMREAIEKAVLEAYHNAGGKG